MASPFRFDPCPTCCEPPPVVCGICQNDAWPSAFLVDVSGFADEECSGCSEANGQFVADYYSCTTGTGAITNRLIYYYTDLSPNFVCTWPLPYLYSKVFQVQVELRKESGRFYIKVIVSFRSDYENTWYTNHVYELDMGTEPFDCGVTELELPYTSRLVGPGDPPDNPPVDICDGTAATVKITAIFS